MLSAPQEVERLLDQIRGRVTDPVVERASNQISVLCSAYMEPDQSKPADIYGLTKTKAGMFNLLFKRLGQTVSRDALMNVAEHNTDDGPESPFETLRVQICKLRQHIKPHGFEIVCVRDAGYKMTRDVAA